MLGEKRDSLPLVMNGDSVLVKGLSESRVRSESVGLMSRCTTRTMCIGCWRWAATTARRVLRR